MLFHLVEMSNNCKKKGKEGRKKNKYLTSDLSSGINKRLSPNVKKRKKKGKSNLLFAILFALPNPLAVFVF